MWHPYWQFGDVVGSSVIVAFNGVTMVGYKGVSRSTLMDPDPTVLHILTTPVGPVKTTYTVDGDII